MRRALVMLCAIVACEEVTDPIPRDAGGGIEASAEVPEAGAPCSTIDPCLPGTTDAGLGGDGGV